MLTLVGAENFKSFKNFSYLKLGKKITLVYGKNSSGKSSILQVLKILGNGFTAPGIGLNYDGVEGEMNEFLHKASKLKEFSIYFDYKFQPLTGFGTHGLEQALKTLKLDHLRIKLDVKLKGSKNYIEGLTLYGFRLSNQMKVPGLGYFTNEGEDIKLFQLKLEKIEGEKSSAKINKKARDYFFISEDELSKEYLRYKCVYLCDKNEIWEQWYNRLTQELIYKFDIKKIRFTKVGFKNKKQLFNVDGDRTFSPEINKLIDNLKKIKDKTGTDQLSFFKEKVIQDFCKNFRILTSSNSMRMGAQGPAGLSSLYTRRSLDIKETILESLTQLNMRLIRARGGSEGNLRKMKGPNAKRLIPPFGNYKKNYQFFSLPFMRAETIIPGLLSRLDREVFNKIFTVHSTHSEFEKMYRVENQKYKSVGRLGENTPQILKQQKKLLKEVNNILSRSLKLKLNLKNLKIGNESYITFTADDLRSSKFKSIKMSLAGKGFNSIIPYLTEAFNHNDSYVIMEEMENSLHPSAVSPILEILTKSKNGNKYILETHSENIVLKLQQLVKNKAIMPEDVSINYVSRNKSESTIKNIQLDKNGNFINKWPEEFFPERKNIILNRD